MQRSSSRRQTLGPVSVNRSLDNGNRRKSVDPTHAAKSRPPRGRASMIPRVGRENMVPPTPPSTSSRTASSTSRRSSVGGDRRQSIVPPSVAARTDPRPVSDKNFQQQNIKKLMKFLMDNGYDHPISHKSLVRPSGKDFSQIATFLLRHVDPNFQDGTMKIEDEIAMNFRAMGYPFTVSKTSLVAAGSPHAWPSLLAALTWLVERVRILMNSPTDEEESTNFESLEELESKTDKAFFKYLSASYTAFLRGDEQMTEELEVSLAERFEKDDTIIEEEIEHLTDKNAVIVEQINNLSRGEQDLEEYVEKRNGYSTDLEQFHDLIDQMDNHVATLSQKKKERTEELAETNRKLERTTTHVEELKEAVRSQSLSLEDMEKIKNELKGIAEASDRVSHQKTEKKNSLWGIQSETDKTWSELEASTSEYNSNHAEICGLQMTPGNEIPRILTIDKEANKHENILGVEFSSKVEKALLALKQEYIAGVGDCKWKYQGKLDGLERSEEGFSETLERLKIVESRMKICEETLRAEKEAHDAKLAIRLREAESMEAKVASLRDPVVLEEQIAQFERQCAELEALRIKDQEENVSWKREIRKEIEEACARMKQYDTFCLAKVSEVQRYKEQKLRTYGKVRLPS